MSDKTGREGAGVPEPVCDDCPIGGGQNRTPCARAAECQKQAWETPPRHAVDAPCVHCGFNMPKRLCFAGGGKRCKEAEWDKAEVELAALKARVLEAAARADQEVLDKPEVAKLLGMIAQGLRDLLEPGS